MSICQTLSVELVATSLLRSISCLHNKREGIGRRVAQWDSASTEKWKVTVSVLPDAFGRWRTLRPVLIISLANTQRYDNIVVRSEHRATNTQSCSDSGTSTSELQRCSNIAYALNSKFNSHRATNAVLKTFMQLQNRGAKSIKSILLRYYYDNIQRRYYDVKFTTSYHRCLNVG